MPWIPNNSLKHLSFVYTQLNDQSVLFLTIQFSIIHFFAYSLSIISSIWSIDRTLLSATCPGQSGLGSDGNGGIFSISLSSSITATSPSDCLVPYQGYSMAGGILLHCRDLIGVFYSPNRQGQTNLYILEWDEMFIGWKDHMKTLYLLQLTFWSMECKHWNTDGINAYHKVGAMLKSKHHLVTFCQSILLSRFS